MISADEARSSPIKFYFPTVNTQPANAVGVIGGQVSFTAVFSSTNPALVTFQWQIQTDGATWGNLVETMGFYEGVTTATLTVKALDNFLATRPTCNFRCRALFANAVPSFSASASLTIPIHTNWSPQAGASGHAARSDPADPWRVTTAAVAAPAIFGMSGPFTYVWTQIGNWDLLGLGTLAGSNLTTASPFFTYTFFGNPSGGITSSAWKCTISNGTHSVTTDAINIFAITDPDLGSLGYQFASSPAEFSSNGGPISIALAPPVGSTLTFVSWSFNSDVFAVRRALSFGIQSVSRFSETTPFIILDVTPLPFGSASIGFVIGEVNYKVGGVPPAGLKSLFFGNAGLGTGTAWTY